MKTVSFETEFYSHKCSNSRPNDHIFCTSFRLLSRSSAYLWCSSLPPSSSLSIRYYLLTLLKADTDHHHHHHLKIISLEITISLQVKPRFPLYTWCSPNYKSEHRWRSYEFCSNKTSPLIFLEEGTASQPSGYWGQHPTDTQTSRSPAQRTPWATDRTNAQVQPS
jgi:hypothetical protein